MKHLSRWAARLIVPAVVAATVASGAAAAAAQPQSQPQSPATAHRTTAPATVISWHALTLTNGWKSASMSKLVTGTPAYALSNGVVYLRGAIERPAGQTSLPFAQLPTQVRPSHNLYLTAYTAEGAAGILWISHTGGITADEGNASSFTSLSGISYPAPTMKSSKLVLEHGWVSSQSVYDTGDPSYTISGGVVYLSGSLNNTSSGTVNHIVNLLPKAARPAQELIIATYEFDGSTGYLEILPTGQLEAIGANAVNYTSLAGVSYPAATAKWNAFTLQGQWKSGATKFHTAAPEYTIINGVVYLNGSIYEAKNVNGFWTYLPAGVRTGVDVLDIETDASGGNPGDITITDSPGIVYSNPQANSIKFTSLAGIAYPQSS